MATNKMSLKWFGISLSRDEKYAILGQRLDHLYDVAVAFVVGVILFSSLMSILLWDRQANGLLLPWSVVVICLALIQYVTILWYQKNRHSLGYKKNNLILISVFLAIISFFYGMLPFLFPMSDMIIQLVFLLFYTIFIAFGLVILAPFVFTFWLYATPIIVFPALNFIFYSTDAFIGWFFLSLLIPIALMMTKVFGFAVASSHHNLRYKTLSDRLASEKKVAEDAKNEAERANQGKSRFIAAASHDLRQPLHALSLFCSQLDKGSVTEERRKLYKEIESAVDALRLMLNGLLDLSRIEANAITPKLSVVSIRDLFRKLEPEFDSMAATKGLKLSFASTRACTTSDAALLDRILRNLIANSIRYTTHGGVVVGVRYREDCYIIQISDTGIGIENPALDNIFDEFYQIGNPERDREKGVGLGLSIVKKLTSLLGHKVEVRSLRDHGTSFFIEVPKLPASAIEEDEHKRRPLEKDIAGLIVLVIDDDKAILKAMKMTLESWGCLPLLAESGLDAEQLLDSEGVLPDVMIVDYRLREHERGTQAISRLRGYLGVDVFSVLLTGDMEVTSIESISKVRLIHKPIDPVELNQLLSNLDK